jgi:hypothetical protein
MTQLDRRLQKLEAVTDTDKVALLFITWMKREGEPPRRMATEWKGDQFSQDLGESEESFLDRVRDVHDFRVRGAARCGHVQLFGIDDAPPTRFAFRSPVSIVRSWPRRPPSCASQMLAPSQWIPACNHTTSERTKGLQLQAF